MNPALLSAHVYTTTFVTSFGGYRWLGIYNEARQYLTSTLYASPGFSETRYK